MLTPSPPKKTDTKTCGEWEKYWYNRVWVILVGSKFLFLILVMKAKYSFLIFWRKFISSMVVLTNNWIDT